MHRRVALGTVDLAHLAVEDSEQPTAVEVGVRRESDVDGDGGGVGVEGREQLVASSAAVGGVAAQEAVEEAVGILRDTRARMTRPPLLLAGRRWAEALG